MMPFRSLHYSRDVGKKGLVEVLIFCGPEMMSRTFMFWCPVKSGLSTPSKSNLNPMRYV